MTFGYGFPSVQAVRTTEIAFLNKWIATGWLRCMPTHPKQKPNQMSRPADFLLGMIWTYIGCPPAINRSYNAPKPFNVIHEKF